MSKTSKQLDAEITDALRKVERYQAIKRAAKAAYREACTEDPSGERLYCVPLAEKVYLRLRDEGFADRELFRPMYGHIWVGVDDYIVDLFEPVPGFKVKIIHYQDPAVHRKGGKSGHGFHWPGKQEGVRPSDVWKRYSYDEVEDFYNTL